MSHPLDNEFNVTGTSFDDDFIDEVRIPDDPELQNLELVIKLALTQYKQNADDMTLFEPKSRIKVMEINTALLNTVKDARFKLETLRLKANSSSGKKSSQAEPEQSVGVNRNELAERAAKLRAVK